MRGILLLAVAIGACAILSGCDQEQQTAQSVAPAAPACACRPTPPQETANSAQASMPMPAPTSHHYHHWLSERMIDMARNEHRRWRGDYSRTDFSESVLAPYDYVSDSSASYSESDVRYDNGDHAMRSRGPHDTIAATMTGERLDPWRGYGVDCPRY